MNIQKFDHFDSLITALSQTVYETLSEGTSQQNECAMVLSGGSTPQPLYRQMASLPLDWNKIKFVLSDERWVPLTDSQSNFNMVQKTLSPSNQKLNLIPMVPEERFWSDDSPDINQHIATLAGAIDAIPHPYKITLLGMGEDGHTASLFPNAPELEPTLRSDETLAMLQPDQAPYPRISMTLRELLRTERVIILINGEKKWDVLQKAIQDKNISTAPITALLFQEQAASQYGLELAKPVPVDIYWAP